MKVIQVLFKFKFQLKYDERNGISHYVSLKISKKLLYSVSVLGHKKKISEM